MRERDDFDRQKETFDRATKGPRTLKDAKNALYDKIKVSVKTMDIIIYSIVALIFIVLAIGIIVR